MVIKAKLFIMTVLKCSNGLLLELDYLILFCNSGRRCHSSLFSLLRLLFLSLLLESIVLCCDLGKLIILLSKLLLKSNSLPLQIKAVILLHVVLLFKDEKILTFFI